MWENEKGVEVMDLNETQAIPSIPLDEEEMDEVEDDDKSKPVAFLQVLENKHVEKTIFPLFTGENVIGRDRSSSVCIKSQTLSKQHAVISIKKGSSYCIYDVGSLNKTKKSSCVLKPGIRYELQHEDIIVFADIECQFTLPETKSNDSNSDNSCDSLAFNKSTNVEKENSEDDLATRESRDNNNFSFDQSQYNLHSNGLTQRQIVDDSLQVQSEEENEDDEGKDESVVVVPETPAPTRHLDLDVVGEVDSLVVSNRESEEPEQIEETDRSNEDAQVVDKANEEGMEDEEEFQQMETDDQQRDEQQMDVEEEEKEEISPENEENQIETAESPPETDETPPETDENVAETAESPPETDENPDEKEETPAETEENTVKNEEEEMENVETNKSESEHDEFKNAVLELLQHPLAIDEKDTKEVKEEKEETEETKAEPVVDEILPEIPKDEDETTEETKDDDDDKTEEFEETKPEQVEQVEQVEQAEQAEQAEIKDEKPKTESQTDDKLYVMKSSVVLMDCITSGEYVLVDGIVKLQNKHKTMGRRKKASRLSVKKNTKSLNTKNENKTPNKSGKNTVETSLREKRKTDETSETPTKRMRPTIEETTNSNHQPRRSMRNQKTLEQKEVKPAPKPPKTPKTAKKDETATKNAENVVKPKILFTGGSDKKISNMVESLGGSVVESIEECTHLISDKIRRTVKLLCTLSKGNPIVTTEWINASFKKGHFIDPTPFLVDDRHMEQLYKFSLIESLKKANNKRLLTNYSIHVTESVLPAPDEMKKIIECAGGEFLSKLPTNELKKSSVLIVSCPEDLPICSKAIKNKIKVVDKELILTGVLRQEFDVGDYLLTEL